MNIIHLPQAMPGQNMGALEIVTEGPSHELLGAERNDRGAGAARMLPYGMLPAQCDQQALMKAKRCFTAPADSESDTKPIPPCCRRRPLGYLCCIWSIILKLSAIYISPTGARIQFSTPLGVIEHHKQFTRHYWISRTVS
jgi:hypothetical protein